MTVGVAQHRINEMKGIVDKLANCLEKMRYEKDRSKIDVKGYTKLNLMEITRKKKKV
jgi:Ribonuclease G/E